MKFFILSKEDFLRIIACFLLGIILGGTIVNTLLSHRLNQLILDKQVLIQQMKEDQQRLKQLEKCYPTTPVIKNIILKLSSEEDNHTEAELEKEIKELLIGLVGLKIDQIDTTILRDIIHNRAIPINGVTFLLSVETIIVDDELTFIVKVKNLTKKVAFQQIRTKKITSLGDLSATLGFISFEIIPSFF